jgi:hypothetical protein
MKLIVGLIVAMVLFFIALGAKAAPFETSAPQACTNLDHYVLHVGTSAISLVPTTNTGGQCYVHYDIGPLIAGLSTTAANALLATYTVTAANAIGMETSAVPFASLPGLPSAPGQFTVTTQ